MGRVASLDKVRNRRRVEIYFDWRALISWLTIAVICSWHAVFGTGEHGHVAAMAHFSEAGAHNSHKHRRSGMICEIAIDEPDSPMICYMINSDGQ
jgi:hypothetical protein